jgi:adenylate cyclase
VNPLRRWAGPGEDARLARQTAVRTSVLLMVANTAGALLTAVYLFFLSPLRAGIATGHGRLVNLIVFESYLATTVVLGNTLGYLQYRPIGDWLARPRPLTRAEQERVLSAPARLVRSSVFFWTLAAVLFAALNYQFDHTGLLSMRVGCGVLLGGMTTVAVAYLALEPIYRPAVARALRQGEPARTRSLSIRGRLLMTWALGSGVPLLAIGSTQLFRSPEERLRLALPVWFLVAAGLASGLFTIVVASSSVARPVDDVRRGLLLVRAGNLDADVQVNDVSELGLLQHGFNEMAEGLRERRRLQDLFGRHVGEDVARQALERGVSLGGETRDASILFVDLVGSTQLAIERSAAEVVSILNDFFHVVVDCVTAEGGWVNKFEGDGAMCVFGAPTASDGHARAALRAARSLSEALMLLGRKHSGLRAGIGVACGTVVAGNVGAEERYEYTVIGDPVNEASRLSDEAKRRGLPVLAAEAAVRAGGDEADRWEPYAELELRGRSTVTRAYAPR